MSSPSIKLSAIAWFAAMMLVLVIVAATATGQSRRPLKMYISVDMEGLGGVTSPPDVGVGPDPDYEMFRHVMTQEVNAAVDGAYRAGATYVLVEEHHGVRGFRNIILTELDPRAELIRGWPRPRGGVSGLDSSFSAAMFIGYHAMAGTPNAILAHTFLGAVKDFRVNGRSVGEGGFNAIVAGAYGVPVVLVSGDNVVVQQMKALLGNVEGVVVKRALTRTSGIVVPPAVSEQRIREGAERALKHLSEFHPLRFSVPYKAEIEFTPQWDIRIPRILADHPEISLVGPRTLGRVCQSVQQLIDFYLAALDIGPGSAPELGPPTPQPAQH